MSPLYLGEKDFGSCIVPDIEVEALKHVEHAASLGLRSGLLLTQLDSKEAFP